MDNPFRNLNPALKAVLIVASVVLCIVLVTWGVAAAVQYWSNPVTVQPQPTLKPTVTPTPSATETPVTYTVTLAANTTVPYIGEAITLTATITPPIEGVTVIFLKNNDIQGNAVTNEEGIAVYTTAPITGSLSRVYNATCTI